MNRFQRSPAIGAMARSRSRRDFLRGSASLIALGAAGCNRTAPTAPPNNPLTGFRDVAAQSGIDFTMRFLPNEQGEIYKVNLYDHGSGLAVGDFDGDGHDDIYFVNQLGPNALYKNRGDGTFIDVTAQAGVALGDRICVAAVFADYDNDGRQDLFVTSVRGGNVLFHNEGNGRFVDVTEKAGLTHIGHSQAAVFFDYNRDGLLDLLVTNTAGWTTNEFNRDARYYTGRNGLDDMQTSPIEHNILYRNNGNGTFTDVTHQVGLEGLGWAADAIAFDFDEDGWIDLVVTNMFGRSQLYRNMQGKRFVDVTSKTLGKTSWGGMGASVFDYNNDGRLDLFITDMHSDMWLPNDAVPSIVEEKVKYATVRGRMDGPHARAGAGGPGDVVYGNTMFRNEGGGRFTEVSDQAGMETFWPWGSAVGDFDNDGFVDVFIPSGMGYPFFYWRNYLMMNNGNGTFTDRSRAEGIDPPTGGPYQQTLINGKQAARSSRAAVAADFDGDGRLDIVTNNFNDHPYLLKNLFPQQNYVRFSLTGTHSNRDALGAVLHLHTAAGQMVRQVQGAGGYLSCPSKVVHFGLGSATAITQLEIRWPSGIRQILKDLPINQLHRISEPVAS